MTHSFIPIDFDVPESISTTNFYLTTLAPVVSEIDYEAVMSSKIRLRTIFGENTEWPRDSMTQEGHYKDLLNHENEFKSRKAFAYSVLTNSKEKCIGSVYIDPCNFKEFDSEVYLWVRDDSIHLDNELFEFISNWIRTYWPFANIAFPGREISWSKWTSFNQK
jgi:hypothetical protein